MTDRIAQYLIEVGADGSDLKAIFAGLKSQVRSDVAELESITNKADLFSTLQDNIPKIKTALASATDAAAGFAAQIEKVKASGAKVGDDLTKSLNDALKAARAANDELKRQQTQLDLNGSSLRRLGVDTTNITAVQAKYNAALVAATEAAKVQEAQQALGLVTTKSIEAEIAKLTLAYTTLAASGKLSATEIEAAQTLLAERTAALRASVTSLPTAFENFEASASGALGGLTTKALATVASLAVLTQGIHSVVDAAREFENSLGEINAATDFSAAQLHRLGDGARDVAVEFGTKLPEAMTALKTILRSGGLGPEDALATLSVSAKTAEAAVADVNTVAKLGTQILNAYQIPVGELQSAFDKLFAASKAGGPELASLGDEFGKLLLAARQSNIPFDVVVASLASITKATGDASGSVGDLQKLILKFDTAQVQQGLRAAGVQATTFAGVMAELTAKHLNIADFTDLGLASSKTGVAIAGLTGGVLPLPDALKKVADSSGAVEEGFRKMENTPKEQLGQLWATTKDLFVTLGDTGPISSFVGGLTTIAKALDDAFRKTKALSEARHLADLEARADASGLQADAEAVDAYRRSIAALAGNNEDSLDRILARAAVQAKEATTSIAALNTQISAQQSELDRVSAALQADIKALNDSAAQEISLVQKIADEKIAALDRSVAAAIDTSNKTVAINAQAAADILKIIKANEQEVQVATDLAIEARRQALLKQKKSEEQIEGELAQIRIASIKPTIAAYQSLYDTLIKQQQDYAAKIRASEEGLRAFQQALDRQIFDLRLNAVDAEGKAVLSNYDKEVIKANESERLISLAREAAAQGDTKLAEKYANDAIALAGKITVAYDEGGKEVVSLQTAQATQLRILKEAGDAVTTAYQKQGEAAKIGLNATNDALATTKGKLDDILAQQKEMKELADKGLKVTVQFDEGEFVKAKQKLDELTADRVVKVGLKIIDDASGQFQSVPVPPSFAKGGPVPAQIAQAFAKGGDVFRTPSWNKVPGIGNADTVPARLNAGSFVVKKSASQYYGDGIMSAMAQGYAGGGDVRENLRSQLQQAQQQLHDIIQSSVTALNPLIDGAKTLPRSAWGQNFGDALSAIRNLITSSTDPALVSAFADPILQFAPNIAAAIQDAHRWNVPLVFGVSAGGERGGTFDQNSPSALYQTLAKMVATAGGSLPGTFARGKAGGGSIGSDTVPAWLTPGEWVINRDAVKLFGGGFLHAINNMQIPKAQVQALSMPAAPARHYAVGGYVDGPGAPRMSVASGAGGGVTVNIYAQRVDAEEVRRTIVPEINRLLRQSN